MKTTTTSTTNTTKTTTRSCARAAIAAAIAAALSLGATAPAIAEEANPAVPAEDQQFVQAGDASDEQGWDASADENGFGSDANALVEDDGTAADGQSADDLESAYGANWWYRRVSPQMALWSAEDYFGVYDYDSWDYATGRYRGIPAYRVVIDDYDGWQPWEGTGRWWGGTRYVAFVNYFTGRVIDGYVTYIR